MTERTGVIVYILDADFTRFMTVLDDEFPHCPICGGRFAKWEKAICPPCMADAADVN